MAEIETEEIKECLYMHNFRENNLDEQSRTGYPCNENRIPCNENRIPCNENGIPAMITGNGFAVKGVFLSKKSSLLMAHFSAENGLLLVHYGFFDFFWLLIVLDSSCQKKHNSIEVSKWLLIHH